MAAHRYWRINVTDTEGAGLALIKASLAEIEFRTSLGGADVTGSGVAIQSVGTGSNAFDNATGTDWDSVFGNALPQYVGYDFGLGNDVDIVEVAITASATTPETAPWSFTIDSSDDGTTWTTEDTTTLDPAWTAGEQRIFAFGAALPTGASSLIVRHVIIHPTGSSSLLIRHKVVSFGASSLGIRHVIVQPTGALSLIVRHVPVQTGASSLPIRHVIQATTQGDIWRCVITLDGIDISAQLLGGVDIEANAGAARLADFTLRPLLGAIDSQAWVKKPVTITYETLTNGVVQTSHRRYTGFVNDATYDPVALITTFECSDFLQDSFEGKNFSFIDGLIGGNYSDAIFNETANGWEYAQQRLESQTAHYDKDVHGAGRKWSWAVAGTAAASYTEANTISESLSLTQNTARDIVNQVDITFQYRLPRKWQRELNIAWIYPFSIAAYLSNPTTVPTRDMFLGSLPSDWWVKSLYFTKMPPTGSYLNLLSTVTPFFISEEIHNSLIWGVSGIMAKRWVQDIVESYTLTVKNQASIDEFGLVNADEKYSVDSLDDGEFEDIPISGIVNTSATDNSDSYASPDYASPPAGATRVDDDYYIDPTARATFDNAINTALNIAKVDILRSHRANEVGLDGIINPALDIGVTVDITTAAIVTKGIIGQLKETYDIDAGIAQFEASVNVYAPNVASQASSAITAPTLPNLTPVDDAVSIPLNTFIGNVDGNQPQATWTGYLGNFTYNNPNSQNAVDTENTPAGLVKYPIEFRTTVPAVANGRRDETTFSAAQTYHVAIPQNTLTILAV